MIAELERQVKLHPLAPWIKAQRGLGYKQLGRLLGAIGDPSWHPETDDREEHPRTLPELNAYCGMVPGLRRARGVPAAEVDQWSAEAKMRLFLVAEKSSTQLDRACKAHQDTERPWVVGHVEDCRCGPYRLVYEARRAWTADRVHSELCPPCGPAGKPALSRQPLVPQTCRTWTRCATSASASCATCGARPAGSTASPTRCDRRMNPVRPRPSRCAVMAPASRAWADVVLPGGPTRVRRKARVRPPPGPATDRAPDLAPPRPQNRRTVGPTPRDAPTPSAARPYWHRASLGPDHRSCHPSPCAARPAASRTVGSTSWRPDPQRRKTPLLRLREPTPTVPFSSRRKANATRTVGPHPEGCALKTAPQGHPCYRASLGPTPTDRATRGRAARPWRRPRGRWVTCRSDLTQPESPVCVDRPRIRGARAVPLDHLPRLRQPGDPHQVGLLSPGAEPPVRERCAGTGAGAARRRRRPHPDARGAGAARESGQRSLLAEPQRTAGAATGAGPGPEVPADRLGRSWRPERSDPLVPTLCP